MTRVADFRVDVVNMLESDYWSLPTDTRRLIDTYARQPLKIVGGNLVFELPIYRWQEIQDSLRRLDAARTLTKE